MQSATQNARDRIRLFRLAWDATSSSFGARQAPYERYFFGDPVRVAGAKMAARSVASSFQSLT